MHLDTLISGLALALVAVGVYVLNLAKRAIEAAVDKTAESYAEALAARREWPDVLRRELEKARGSERQELRFASYGALWKALRPLAIYDGTPIDRASVTKLSETLTDWYFSDCGGLLLTRQTREFYFALQDLLRVVERTDDDWSVERSAGDQRARFRKLLSAGGRAVLEYFEGEKFDDWQQAAMGLGAAWRKSIQGLAARWAELKAPQRFATLQQVGSVLRSSLANDVESRLR